MGHGAKVRGGLIALLLASPAAAQTCLVATPPLPTELITEARAWLWQHPAYTYDRYARLQVRFGGDMRLPVGEAGARDTDCAPQDNGELACWSFCTDPATELRFTPLGAGRWQLETADFSVVEPGNLTATGMPSPWSGSPECGWLADITSADPEHPPATPLRLTMAEADPAACADFAPAPVPDPTRDRACWQGTWDPAASATGLASARLESLHFDDSDTWGEDGLRTWYATLSARFAPPDGPAYDAVTTLTCFGDGWPPAPGEERHCSGESDGQDAVVSRDGDGFRLSVWNLRLTLPGGVEPDEETVPLLTPAGEGATPPALHFAPAPLATCNAMRPGQG